MGASDHVEAVKKTKFCTIRADKCGCGNRHTDCVKLDIDISKNFFYRGRNPNPERHKKRFEAHHLLCISSVTKFKGTNPKISDVVKLTKWCINDKHNMIAMPSWGHTIQYYFDFITGDFSDEELPAPKFENLPMHNYGHNGDGSYIKDVEKELKDISREIKDLVAEHHESPEKELKDMLEDLSTDFREILSDRGTRCGGTHSAWQKGAKDPESDWYKPFSMAKKPQPRRFAAKGFGDTGRMAEKMKTMMKAFKQWGTQK
jgi:hypothetical protein